MARDVDFNVTASDKTGPALAAVERGFAATAKKLQKQQEDVAGSGLIQAVARSSPQLAAKLTGVFSQVASAGPALLVTGLVAAAPALGATISAAVIGGAGVGGVIGGVMLAARDPRVAGAGTQLAQKLLGKLEQDATPFVKPVLTAIGTIDRRFDQSRDHIQSIFRNSAQFVAPLTDGLLSGVDGVLRGFDALVSRGKPVMDQLGTSFNLVGQAFGDAAEIISGGSEDAASALGDLTTAITFSIQSAGALVRILTEAYGVIKFVSPVGEALVDTLGRVTGGQDAASQSAADLAAANELSAKAFQADADATARTNQYLADSEKLMAETAQAARDLTSANQSLYGAETQLGEATARATKARQENGRTLDANTEKGRANREALLAVASAAQKDYEAFVKVNGVGPRSVALGESMRAKFIQTARSLGASSTEANRLANSILGIPQKHDTKINADPRNAVEASKAAKAAINSVHSKTVSVNVSVHASQLASIENRLNRLGGSLYNAADGGWAASDPSSGRARAGGPTPVSVTSNVAVSLDGQPFHAQTVRVVEQTNRRRDFRDRVGAR